MLVLRIAVLVRNFSIVLRIRIGHEIRAVQELLEHQDVKKTEFYTLVMNRPGPAVKSPLDRMAGDVESGSINAIDVRSVYFRFR